jgi:type II secretory pathway pseudopilin PulG
MKKKYFKNNRGYTIVETMISISIFLILIMTGMATLMNAFSVHKKSQNMRSAIDNLSFIIEDMSRNLRTGTQYYCLDFTDVNFSNINTSKSSLIDGGVRRKCWGIAFEAAEGGSSVDDQWIYYLDGAGAVQRSVDGGNNSIPLTPSEVKLSTVSGFYVVGAEPSLSDDQQPLVKIILVGSITERGVASPFSLETTVSSRVVDTF